ncbi:hypothetical protein GOV12_02490 [Candidatus Pacearchaeota archaeon]|nr:hypothetical protein [Candidatus Pacearchaeota archaeon]
MTDKICDLKSGQGSVNVEGSIKELGEIKVINKYGKDLKLCNAILEDSSGPIKLTLWNDDAERFKEGDKVKILNGYVSEFQGELQLTSGKFGRMEKVVAEGDTEEVKDEEGKVPAESKKELKQKNEEGTDVYSEETTEEKDKIEEELF